MSVGQPLALTSTTGTSGDPKSFPVYSLDINEAYYICYMLTKSIRSNLFNNCKSVCLNSLNQKIHATDDKLKTYKVSAITTIAALEKQNIESVLKFKQDIVPPIIFHEITDPTDMFLFILLYALQCKDLEVISSTFVTGLIHFFTYMEEKFDLLCKHIEMGTIPADENLSSPLPVDIRLSLESPPYHLPPNPGRASELRQIVFDNNDSFHHISTLLWPQLKCAICIISHNVKQAERKLLSTYWNPVVPIYPYVYGMSEHHRIAIPLRSNSYELVPTPRTVYYEFIEVKNDDGDGEDDDEKVPESLQLNGIEEGKCYEVVLTTYDGLYRYRTEDIIRVRGHYCTLPTWELLGRRGQYLSISSEHVTEIELRSIVDPILFEHKHEFPSSPMYSIFIDKTSSNYILAIEYDHDESETDKDKLTKLGKELCAKFDDKLQKSNEEYQKCRSETKKISAPSVLWLKKNILTTGIREFRLKGGKSQQSNQLKSNLIMKPKNKDMIKFLKDNKVLKIDL